MSGIASLLLLAVFIGIGCGWRSWLHRRRFGGSGIVLFQSGRWDQHLREASLLGLGAVLVAQAVAALVAPSALEAMRLLTSDDTTWWLGVSLMLAGTALMVVAQLDMGASWRFGLDESAGNRLRAEGRFGWF